MERLSNEDNIRRVSNTVRWHFRDVLRGGDGINDEEVIEGLFGMLTPETVEQLRAEAEEKVTDDPDKYVAKNRARRKRKEPAPA